MKTENNIKDKEQNKIMKQRLMIFFFGILFLFSFNNVFAESEILALPFEEGSGNFIFDFGKYNLIFEENGLRWESSPKKWGQYSIDFDGGADWFTTQAGENLRLPLEKTLSFWVYYEELSDSDMDNLFHTWNDEDKLIIKYSSNLNRVEVFETDSTGELRQYNFTPDLTPNVWEHAVFTWTNTTLSLWINNTIIETKNIINPDSTSRIYNYTYFGVAINSSTGDDLKANLDSVRFYDFALSSNQIQNLYENDYTPISTFTTPVEEDDIDSIQQLDFITDFSLEEGENYSNPVEVTTALNQTANCEFYINRDLSCTKENILSCNDEFIFDYGENKAQIYCYFYAYDEGQLIKYYDTTEEINFNVSLGALANVGLTITGSDFVVDDYNLYAVSPCLKEGITHLVSEEAFSNVFNPEGILIKKLNSGYVEMNLTQGDYELCIFHGIIDYDTSQDNKTTEYNVNQFYNQIKIGTLSVPDNSSQYYAVELENFNLYGKTNPKAWGTSWVALSSGILGLVFGFLIILIGIQTQMPKMTIIGAILIIVSLGFSVTGLFAILI